MIDVDWVNNSTLQALDQLDLLLRQHPGEDLPAVDDPLQQLGVLVPDQPEGVPVAGESVVLVGKNNGLRV